MLKHPPLPYDIPYAFRAYHLIFSDVLEGKREARIFAFDYPNLAKGPFAHDSKQTEVIEVDLVGENDGLCIRIAHLQRSRALACPWVGGARTAECIEWCW